MERKSSCASALRDEINLSSNDGNDNITDARHSARKNSKFTDVVCIGYTSHKVEDHVVVSREDDSCPQRHELIGTKKLYENFEAKNVQVRRPSTSEKNRSLRSVRTMFGMFRFQ